ncbi:MAG TPA: Hpt domain-containing protein, partial [Nitrosospira sp.]|nr:Hpt domain-containing protein [Nitrosospira sp.]
ESSGRIAGELRNACEAGDAQAAGAAAHKLKSSARSVGALELGELSARMEQTGKAGDIKGLKALLPQFDAQLAAVDAYIDAQQG